MTAFCNIPKIWDNDTVFIIGGGNSIISQFGIPAELVQKVNNGELPMSVYSDYMEELFDKHVIGVNAAFKLGEWVDYVFFMDKDFLLTYEHELSQTKQTKVCNLPYSEMYDWCNTVNSITKEGLSVKSNTIHPNFNSGAGAINLAVHLGAKKIVLIGFDMKETKNKTHFHTEYKEGMKVHHTILPFDKHISVFKAIKTDADKLGVEIINTSLKSALKVFKKQSLTKVLSHA